MMAQRWQRLDARNENGFTILEILVAIIILPFVVMGLATATNSIRQSYTLARQYNEIYTVLSACPELDRALEFNSLTSTTNCYPNNSFVAENGQTGTISYAPSLSVTDTASLSSSDPLKAIPDSKVVNISVSFPAPNTSRPALQLRMLITRNGIGQQ
jgi:prepilin-type N-terminal cleavage/methylation domain-containing protein